MKNYQNFLQTMFTFQMYRYLILIFFNFFIFQEFEENYKEKKKKGATHKKDGATTSKSAKAAAPAEDTRLRGFDRGLQVNIV